MFDGLIMNPVPVTVALTSGQILGPNQKRHAVIIGCPPANRITINIRAPAVLDAGITLYPAGPPLILLYDHIGQALREDWYAITVTGTQTIGIWDVLWP